MKSLLAKDSSEHELIEFGIALPVLVTETLSLAVGELCQTFLMYRFFTA